MKGRVHAWSLVTRLSSNQENYNFRKCCCFVAIWKSRLSGMRKRNFFRVALHTFPIQIILQISSPLVRSDKVAWQIETYCKIEEILLAFVRFVPLKVDKNLIAILSSIEKYSAFYKTKNHEWFCKNRHKMLLLEKKWFYYIIPFHNILHVTLRMLISLENWRN